MKKIEVICRKECIADVAAELRKARISRMTASHVHALGSGVDPEDYRMSLEEEAAYTEKTRLEMVCSDTDVEHVIDIVRQHAQTGHRGDGVIFVSDVERAIKIQTGDENTLALL